MSPRLPRFKRAPSVPTIQLTERDQHIIRLVHRHRFLRSSHISKLLNDQSNPPQSLLRRLQLLYHHGYLERPRAQLNYFHQSGNNHIAYGLGNKGGAWIRRELGASFRKLSWGEKNRSVGRIFLEHALLVSDIMVAIECACRVQANVRFMSQDELLNNRRQKPFRWRVQIDSRLKLGVVPDHVFGLEFSDPNGTLNRVLYFLEADRGTMPVIRHTLAQTSFHRKLLAYEATWYQRIHRSRFGFNRFRVLTITSSQGRVESLVDACSNLHRGRGLFVFADVSVLDSPEILNAPLFRSGIPKSHECLLD